MKIIKPMSTFFKVGDVVNMRIVNERGDFVISAGNRKQSFGFLYRNCLIPLGNGVATTQKDGGDISSTVLKG
jgi:hypothetical protein